MPFFIINSQKRIVGLADSLPTQDYLQHLANKLGTALHVIDGFDTGLSALPTEPLPAATQTLHLRGLDTSLSTGLLRQEDPGQDPQDEIISLLASLPERDRQLLARELRHRLVP